MRSETVFLVENELFNLYWRRIIPLDQTSSIAFPFSRLDRETFWEKSRIQVTNILWEQGSGSAEYVIQQADDWNPRDKMRTHLLQHQLHSKRLSGTSLTNSPHEVIHAPFRRSGTSRHPSPL